MSQGDDSGERDDVGRFCPWYPIAQAQERAPDEPGVLQLRRARGLERYPRGQSAMVHYGHGPSLCRAAQTLADQLAPEIRDAVLCRHQATPDPAAAAALYQTLTERFVIRFGTPPTGLS